MHYFDHKALLKKASRYYERGIVQRAWIEGDETLFPLRILFKRIGEKTIREHYPAIRREAEALGRVSLPFEYRDFRFPSIGEQRLPVALRFEERDTLLTALGKEEAFRDFVAESRNVLEAFPSLKRLLIEKPLLIEKYSGAWHRLVQVCRFFLDHPRPDIYLRELPVEGVDTKFIERHRKVLDLLLSSLLPAEAYDPEITTLASGAFERKYGLRYPLPQIRFRILDTALTLSGLDDLAIPVDSFAQLDLSVEKVFVVENKMSFLSFPKAERSIVIFGSGYGVGYLKTAKWLQESTLIYWGDIDSHGFAILSQFRSSFGEVRSMLMDEETLGRYRSLCVEEPSDKRFEGEASSLTEEERSVLERIRTEHLRLEQERIPFDALFEALVEYKTL